MRFLSFAALLSLLPLALLGADSAEAEYKKLEQVRAEVSARRLLREHESGVKKASEAELAAARVVVRNGQELRARAVAGDSAQEFRIDLKNVSAATLIPICNGVLGGAFSVDDSLKGKTFSLAASDTTLEPFQAKFKAELKRNGIDILYMPNGAILCPIGDPRIARQSIRPEPTKSKAPAR